MYKKFKVKDPVSTAGHRHCAEVQWEHSDQPEQGGLALENFSALCSIYLGSYFEKVLSELAALGIKVPCTLFPGTDTKYKYVDLSWSLVHWEIL